MEKWKDIKGYEGAYQVSNTGIVRSLDRLVAGRSGRIAVKKGCVINGCISKFGYRKMWLSANGKTRYYFLHRIIAAAFIKNKESKPFINHKNAIKLDNSISNLEWCTSSENQLHAHKMGLHPKTKPGTGLKKLSNPAAKKVQCLFTGEIMCMTDAATLLGMERKAFSAIMNGRGTNWCSFIFI